MRWLVDLPRYRLSIQVGSASVLFVGMTGFKTYPLILHVSTHIPANLGDPLLIVWILMWDFHALTTKPWSLFYANIFYPVQNTLAFSEHLLGVQPLFGPVYALTGNPVMAYNVVFFLSFVLSGIAMFLSRELNGRRACAVSAPKGPAHRTHRGRSAPSLLDPLHGRLYMGDLADHH
jgi:hypothetical protein